ncbi:MAG: leucyl/phenylalanyl-tRNA--protein transferase, partial [Devosia sp.]|nr:leucyl/phenylalanyl-tRNA--protein transferase [Devosia sp.]
MPRRPDPFTIEITPELIIRAYRAGIFPMAEDAADKDVFWVSPEMRGIIPLDGFHLSASLRKAIRKSPFAIRVDSDFPGIIEGCAT